MKRINLMLTASLIAVLSACSTVPLTGRRQANLVSDAEMQQLAS